MGLLPWPRGYLHGFVAEYGRQPRLLKLGNHAVFSIGIFFGKQFYLLDTVRRIDERFVSNEELASEVMEKSKAAIQVRRGKRVDDCLSSHRTGLARKDPEFRAHMSSYPLPSPPEPALKDVRSPAKPWFCYVCGASQLAHTPVLWPDLVAAWGLSSEEAGYIDVQQGTHCRACGSNVRSIALAKALLGCFRFEGTLSGFVDDVGHHTLRVLEINEAGTLHPVLRRLPRHRLAAYRSST